MELSKNRTTSTQAIINWGILGCSKISSDFCTALQLCGGHKTTAVASKSYERASNFASKFRIDSFFDSYQGLLECKNVDVVYVGTSTHEHYALTLKALEAGKAVLSEKPLCMSYGQCLHVQEVAKKHRKLVVEGMWSNFLPSYDRLRRALVHGEVGEVSEVTVQFGMKFDEEVQVRKKHLGGGLTMGLGCYALHLVVMVFEESPVKVEAKGDLDETGLDLRVEINLEFKGGKKANIKLSGVDEFAKQALIKGSKGDIFMENFWCCEKIEIAGTVYNYPLPQPLTPTNYPKTAGFVHEIERVGEAWRKGLTTVGEVTFNTCRRVYDIIDEVLQQLGVTYDAQLLKV